jgi:putative heme iron utilization protein
MHSTPAPAATFPTDLEPVLAAFRASPRKMAVQLARELGVPELHVVRALAAEGLARELDAARWEELIRAFEPLGKVHVIVTNGAVTLESFGAFGNFSTFGEYFNVQTKDLDMHVRSAQLAHAFAVEKPGHMDGVSTLSVQFFDRPARRRSRCS